MLLLRDIISYNTLTMICHASWNIPGVWYSKSIEFHENATKNLQQMQITGHVAVDQRQKCHK